PVVEAMRGIRFNVMHAHGVAGPALFTITSPGSREGKSFVASNLALAFADAGHRTLLIDGHLRRGSLYRILNTRRKPGLTDVLHAEIRAEQAIQATRYPPLFVVACGTRTPDPPEPLGSEAMSNFIAPVSQAVMDAGCGDLPWFGRASGSATSKWNRVRQVAPAATCSSAPLAETSLRVMASPSPVPEKVNPIRPRLRRNGWYSRFNAWGSIPAPVSRTENSTWMSSVATAATSTKPCSGNLRALHVRLSSARESATGCPMRTSPVGGRRCTVRPCSSAIGRTMSCTDSSVCVTENGQG